MTLFRIANWPQVLTSGNSVIDSPQLIYKPGMIGQQQLHGYLVDLSIQADLRSIAEVVIPSSVNNPLEMEVDAAQTYYDLPKTNPYKKLGFYTSSNGSDFQRLFGIYLFNRRPFFQIDLISKLTRAASAMFGVDGRSGEAIALYACLESEDGIANNTGNLSGSDSLSFWVAANEEAPNALAINPILLTCAIQIPELQFALPIPEGTLSYSFKIRNKPGDIIAPIRYAWQPGIVATGGGYSLDPGAEESESGVFLLEKTLYFAASEAGVVVEFRGWV